MSAAPQSFERPADAEVPVLKRRQIHVLLVEDDEAHAELIRRAFEPRAALMSLTTAGNLAEARAQLTAAEPDVALVDLLLPDGKGIEILPPPGEDPSFPVIIMTSHGAEEVAVESLKAGALNYVVKSPDVFSDMPQIVEGALREWGHVVERRRAEQALQASEEHFRSLIENALDIITVVGEDGTVLYTSPAIERVLGYTPTERVGTDFFELVHPEDRGEVTAKVRAVFAEPRTTERMEYRYRHRDGSLRVLEAIASSHRRSDGQRRAVINSRDVTDRKQAEEIQWRLEEQLRHSQKWEIVGTLAGGIANEFNNMLTPILGFASLALKEATPGSKTHRRLEHILTAANRSKELAEQLLVFSRQAEPERQRVELHRIVAEALSLLRPTLPPSIEIRQELHAENDAVMADPDQIRQVLINLVTNAHHAMPRGGVLEVALDTVEVDAEAARAQTRPRPGSYVRLRVGDTGHGMDSVTRERVLEPFFTTKGADDRSGLGLSVTHGIVVSHGGALNVESAPGKGTTVEVFLPLAERAAAKEVAPF